MLILVQLWMGDGLFLSKKVMFYKQVKEMLFKQVDEVDYKVTINKTR